MKISVLALTGDLDTETPASSQFPALQTQLQRAGNTHVTLALVPQVNHFFQTNALSHETSVFGNSETFLPIELRLLSEWLVGIAKVGSSNGEAKNSKAGRWKQNTCSQRPARLFLVRLL